MLQRLRACRLAQRGAARLLGVGDAARPHVAHRGAAPAQAAPRAFADGGARRHRRGPQSLGPATRVAATAAAAAPPAPDAASPSAPASPAATAEQPSTSAPSAAIYTRPELYDIAFSYRDFQAEVKFLQDAYRKHGGGGQLGSLLELGCGPARHLAGLAKAGVPKLVGLDLSPDMLAHARASLAKAGRKAAAVELVQGDMSAFDLPHKAFDMVTCLLGTFSHLLQTQHAIATFRAAAAHLRPGGLLLLELSHPGDLFDGSLIIGESGKEVWEVPYNGDKVFVEWGAEYDNFDPVTQIVGRTVVINVLRGDEVADSVEELVPYRQYTVRELELLAAMTGFAQVGLYGEMSTKVDLEHEDAYRMVAVYRRD